MQRVLSGCSIRRVVDRSGTSVPEHAHEWAVLSIFVMGSYLNETELGRSFIAGPSAVLYRPGVAHRNTIGPVGFEQIEVEFDPDWLGDHVLPPSAVSRWHGRRSATASLLAHACNEEATDAVVRTAVQHFIARAMHESEHASPEWVGHVTRRLRAEPAVSAVKLAEDVRRHPSWLGTAFKRATGEGLREAAARFRVEHAARLLRETDDTCASIAAAAGFCYQSHMIWTFQRALGRLPSAVRKDRQNLRTGAIISSDRLN